MLGMNLWVLKIADGDVDDVELLVVAECEEFDDNKEAMVDVDPLAIFRIDWWLFSNVKSIRSYLGGGVIDRRRIACWIDSCIAKDVSLSCSRWLAASAIM